MSFHISQRFIDELLEEDCPYMDLTVEALGIGREPGLLTCHPKAACVVAGVEVAARLLESSGCRVACEAASGDRLEAGQVFLRAEGSAGAIHRSLKIAQNVMEYSSGIATRAAGMLESARKANPHVQLAVTRKHFPGTKRLSLAAAQAGGAIAHRLGLSDSLLVFDALHHLAGGTAQLPLVLGGRHYAHGPQCRPGRHAQQHTGRSLICLLFHCKHSFPCPLCGPLAVVFPVKNPLYAFFVQKVVVYCSMVFQAVLPFGGILPALDPYKVRRFLI